MNELKFGIAIEDGRIIAAFVNECDRDYSMDALAEIFADAEFTADDAATFVADDDGE